MALTRSMLDNGNILYGSGSSSTLQSLDTIHHAGIRLYTGTLRASRIDCLFVDAGEFSLSRR